MDEAFAKSSTFTQLVKKANVAHIVYDLGYQRQIDDKDIYQIADSNNRFVVTINFKDFKKLIQKKGPGVFGLDSGLSNAQIDKILCNFISGKDSDLKPVGQF